MNYELLLTVAFMAQVTSYFYCTSNEFFFAYQLRITVNCTSYELFLTYELQVTVYCMS